MQQTYTDTFEHSFDEKGRITVPREWRGEGFESLLHVIPSEEGCLKVYPGSFLARCRQILDAEKVSSSDPRRKALERLASTIQQVTPDANNRLSIKDKFRRHANLAKTAVLAGKFDHFEMWDPQAWKQHQDEELTYEAADRIVGF